MGESTDKFERLKVITTGGHSGDHELKTGATAALVLDNAFDGILVTDRHGIIETVNRAAQKIFGYQSTELIGCSVGKIMPSPHQEAHDGYIAEYLKTGKENVLEHGRECIGRKKDGTVFPVDIAVTEIQLGGEKKFIGTVRDITRLRLAEGGIKEAYEIINQSPAVVFLWKNDEGWPVEYVSNNVKELFGYTAEEFISGEMAYSRTIHPDDLERVMRDVAGYSKERERFTHEPYRVITKEGKVKWIDDRTSIRKDEKGRITHYQGIVLDITEHMQAEKRLRDREKQYSLLVENVNSIILRWDTRGRIKFINRFGLHFFGFSKEEIIDKSVLDTIVPKTESSGRDLEAMIGDIAVNPKKYASNQNENKRKNGERVWIEWTNEAVCDESGEPVEILSTGIDITKRKQAEEALKKARNELEEKVRERTAELTAARQGLLEAQEIASLGNWESDMVENKLSWSDEIYRIFGLRPQERAAAHEVFFNAVHPEDRELVIAAINAACEKHKPFEINHRIVLPDGEERIVHERGKVYFNEKNEPARIIGTVQDITDWKRQQEELEKYRRNLEDLVAQRTGELKRTAEERAIYQQGFLHSFDPICFTTLAGMITHVNQAFENLYGYSRDEVIGVNPRLLNPGRAVYADHGIDGQEYDRIFADMWEKITDPAIGYWTGDLLNRKKDGDVHWVTLHIHAIRDDDGKLIAFACMPMDITARLERELYTRLEIYNAITGLAEKRDSETGAHVKRIGLFSSVLAGQLGMSRKFVEDIEIFAQHHDIGKVGIQDRILLKPGKLTAGEFEIMKTHTTLGYEILKGRSTLEMSAEIACFHHEKWDGGGYPQGLKGEETPLSARIVAVADVYDALRSKRPYKKPFTHEKAVAIIKKSRGSHFDPEIADAFLELEEKFRRIAARYHN